MLQIDGAHGEGGGQLLRMAVALSAITERPIDLRNIRARRKPPGLAPQHLLAVRAVAALSAAKVAGLELRATELRFTPGRPAGGSHEFDVGTAGSVALVLQALAPVMLCSAAPSAVVIRGGTDVRAAPPVAYLQQVLLPLLQRMNLRLRLDVKRHGYYPRGGGIVLAQAWPGHPRPLVLATRGALLGIRGQAHVANLPRHVVERMRDAAYAQLPAQSQPTIDTAVLSREQAEGRGGAIVLWASFEGTVLGAGRVAELGVRAETLGEAAAAELAADLHSGATADVHAADQLLVYFALAGGGALLTRTVSPHALTMIWLIEQFLPVRFSSRQRDGLVLVTVEPR